MISLVLIYKESWRNLQHSLCLKGLYELGRKDQLNNYKKCIVDIMSSVCWSSCENSEIKEKEEVIFT